MQCLASPRVDKTINTGWQYAGGDVEQAAMPDFDDSGWGSIDLPHTWNALDGQDGGNNYRRGVGWYRTHLALDPGLRGKALYLRFEGASMVTTVYVNGSEVGTHKGGFGAFCFDITPYVRFTRHEIIAVRVSNAPDSTVPPLSGDFTVFGGIYRGARLLALDSVSLSPLDHASSGVYITQSGVTSKNADLTITAVVRNRSGSTASRDVVCDIVDHRGRVVYTARAPVQMSPASVKNVGLHLSLKNPHLWNGRRDPYLYGARVRIVDGKRICDQVTQPCGIRSFAVDPERGFILNGQPYRLYGVSRHQDREGKGWAIGPEELREDYRLIEEMGCTAVRLAHYQQAQEFYDLCDRGGMVVWAELSLVDKVNASPEFFAACRSQLLELIKQNFNHPSIMFWSLANELIPDMQPEVYDTLVTTLNRLAHALDPTRLTTLASRSRYDGRQFMNTVTDVIAYNVYKGWYEGKPDDFSAYLDDLHARFPHRSIGVGEYGAGASVDQHEIPPHKPLPGGPWHPEEWQSGFHEHYWKVLSQRPFVWGSFVWNMFDFAVDGRNEGDHPGRNDKGLVTYDRTVKKDAFYWYKAQWNPEPMVHITSKRFTPRNGMTAGIKVYSNCKWLRLIVNGGAFPLQPVKGKIGVWDGIALRPGENRIVVEGIAGRAVVRDSCLWQRVGK